MQHIVEFPHLLWQQLFRLNYLHVGKEGEVKLPFNARKTDEKLNKERLAHWSINEGDAYIRIRRLQQLLRLEWPFWHKSLSKSAVRLTQNETAKKLSSEKKRDFDPGHTFYWKTNYGTGKNTGNNCVTDLRGLIFKRTAAVVILGERDNFPCKETLFKELGNAV